MKRTYFNDIFILLTHQGRQFDGCRIGIVKSTGFGYSVQLCLFAKVARCRVDYTAFLEGLVCSKSGDQWQAPVSACLLGQQAERAKAVFLTAIPCQVTESTFPSSLPFQQR